MKHWWWKLLAALLVIGASLAALLVPLAPGLTECVPSSLSPGTVTLSISGYNTRFDRNGPPAVGLTDGHGGIQADQVTVLGPTSVKAIFTIPADVGGRSAHVVVLPSSGERLVLFDAVWTGSGEGSLPDRWKFPEQAAAHGWEFPNRAILYETIRNLMFHVPMWFTMMVLQALSVGYSVAYLRSGELRTDLQAEKAVQVSLFFAALGLLTGSLWARATWGAWWTNDTKLNGAAVTTLIYLAYLVLRGSVADAKKRADLAAVYNIFAFVLMLVFIMVLPRLTDSLHPGNGGNPAFSQYDLDDDLRRVFYPAVLGWIMTGLWLFNLRVRMSRAFR